MTDWIRVRDRLQEPGVDVRLLLKDSGGEYESPYVCRMSQLDEEFYNVDPEHPVKVSERIQILAWRPIKWRGA